MVSVSKEKQMEQGNINFTKEFRPQGVISGHLYRAMVVDNLDPLEIGRVRARVEGLMDSIEDNELLPWAVSRFQHPHGALETTETCGGSGSFSVPATGTIVFLVWQTDDPHTPTYQSYTTDKKTVMSLSKEDYPNTHIVYRFLDCSVLTINTKTHEAYLYNSGKYRVRIDGDSNVTVKGNTDLHIAGKVTGDIYGDTVLNIRQSDLRNRETCECPLGEGTGEEYASGGNGNLTVNVKEHTIVNTQQDLTVNTRNDVYVNTEGDLHATTGGNTKISSNGSTDIKTVGDTKIESGGSTHVYSYDLFVKCNNLNAQTNDLVVSSKTSSIKVDGSAKIETGANTCIKTAENTMITSGTDTHVFSTENVLIRSTEFHVDSERILMSASDKFHINADKLLISIKNMDITAEDVFQVDGGTVLMNNAQIDGIVSKAISVTPGDVGSPNTEDAQAAETAETAEAADGAQTAEKAAAANTGPKANGGSDGWFDTDAKVVEVKG